MVRVAVCVTGLERSYPEIRGNIRTAVFGLLANIASQADVRVFGVKPVNDSWPNALIDFGPMIDTIEEQRPCRSPEAPLPMWFTCTRGSKTTRGGECARSFQQMMCDLAHCEEMIVASEERSMRPFDLVSRLRLDISWERLLELPSNLLASVSDKSWGLQTIWVPQMNRNGGINDKFALGTRRAMTTYLNRVRLFDVLNMSTLVRRTADMKRSPAKWTCGPSLARNCSIAEPCCWPSPLPRSRGFLPNCSTSRRSSCGMPNLNSERFLELTMWLASNITVVHRQDWVLCKYGEIGHSWVGCTNRMRRQTKCHSLVCVAWTAGGCRCQNTTCARGYNPYCVDTSRAQLQLDGGLYASSVSPPPLITIRSSHDDRGYNVAGHRGAGARALTRNGFRGLVAALAALREGESSEARRLVSSARRLYASQGALTPEKRELLEMVESRVARADAAAASGLQSLQAKAVAAKLAAKLGPVAWTPTAASAEEAAAMREGDAAVHAAVGALSAKDFGRAYDALDEARRAFRRAGSDVEEARAQTVENVFAYLRAEMERNEKLRKLIRMKEILKKRKSIQLQDKLEQRGAGDE
ncbi:hypothetical protein AB1Y20_023234 [Prymnesium parvum]|uniref:Uncharacterized protein n=1 Tax=Prymnesium parvum TaxID=97485 RepID=A0AB34JD84_PRYPA